MRNKNELGQKFSWFVLVDEIYGLMGIAEDYNYPVVRYDGIAIGPADWNTVGSGNAHALRISATRFELITLLREFKETYPNANIVVMRG